MNAQTMYLIWIMFASCTIWYTFYYGKLTLGKLAFCLLSVSISLVTVLAIDMTYDFNAVNYLVEPAIIERVDYIHKFIC